MTERKTLTVEIADDEILIAIKRPEDYEDVHPELVAEDAMKDVNEAFRWYVVAGDTGGEAAT